MACLENSKEVIHVARRLWRRQGAMTMRSAKCSRNFSGGYVEASRKWKEP